MINKNFWFGIFAAAVIALFSWIGYLVAYDNAYEKGVAAGYEHGLNEFPQMTWNDLTWTNGEGTVWIGQVTVQGQQHIIDMIADLPELKTVISIPHSKPELTYIQSDNFTGSDNWTITIDKSYWSK